MKKTLVLICVFLLAMFMVGCTTTPQVKYVTEVENNYVVFEPPRDLYKKPKRLKPPYTKTYLTADWEAREEILIDFIKLQEKQIDGLIVDRTQIESWVKDQREAVDKLKKVKK